MLYRCKVCDTPYAHPETAATCENTHTKILPAPAAPAPAPVGMRYEVSCTNLDCYLHRTAMLYGDPQPAEWLAFIHESRWRDEKHVCVVKDLNLVQPSQKPEAATGEKGGGDG